MTACSVSAAGHVPESLHTNARVQLRNVDGAPTLARIDLETEGQGPGVGDDVRFESAIIASGSFPLRPPIDGINSDRCIDSEALLAQSEVPRRLAILGGGVIGCEFASIFHRFGSEVTIIEMLLALLPTRRAAPGRQPSAKG